MKKHFVQFALISLAALGTLTYAQSVDQTAPAAAPATPQNAAPAAHTATPQQQLNHLTRKLALTADQQNQILPILTDREQQVSGVKSDTSLSAKERHSRMAAVHSDAQVKIRGILTDQQRAAYDQMQQQAHDRAKAKRQGSVSN